MNVPSTESCRMNNAYPGFDFSSTKDDLLLIVDTQVDFDEGGVLGNERTGATVPGIVYFIQHFQGKKAATKDTHGNDYLDTQEGRNLPIPHGKRGTPGWEFVPAIRAVLTPDVTVLEKPGFGSLELVELVRNGHFKNIYILGWDTGYCVISNAVLAKAADPEAAIHILARLCACATQETHETALAQMKTLQMDIMT